MDQLKLRSLGMGGELPVPLFAGEGWVGALSAGTESVAGPPARRASRVDLPRKRERCTEQVRQSKIKRQDFVPGLRQRDAHERAPLATSGLRYYRNM